MFYIDTWNRGPVGPFKTGALAIQFAEKHGLRDNNGGIRVVPMTAPASVVKDK